MNRELWRIGAKRAAWILVPLWLFLAVAGTVASTPPPWLFMYGFFTVFGLVAVTLATVTDRRLMARTGRGYPPWRGPLASAIPVETSVAPERALAIAREAVAMAGGADMMEVEPATIVGWIGSAWTNVPRKMQYQLAVSVMAGEGSDITFVCSAQPRFIAMFGAQRSQQLAERLQSEIVSLAAGDSAR